MHGSKFPLGGSIKYSLAISIYLSIYLCNCNTTQEKSCMHIKKSMLNQHMFITLWDIPLRVAWKVFFTLLPNITG